jgi:hypothetical protein
MPAVLLLLPAVKGENLLLLLLIGVVAVSTASSPSGCGVVEGCGDVS